VQCWNDYVVVRAEYRYVTANLIGGIQWPRQLWGTESRALSTSNSFIFSSLWSKSDSQLSKYCVVCEIRWCRCQQLTALSISTALVTKLLVIKPLLHPALKFTVSAPWPNFQLCPSSQQILATPLAVLSSSSCCSHAPRCIYIITEVEGHNVFQY